MFYSLPDEAFSLCEIVLCDKKNNEAQSHTLLVSNTYTHKISPHVIFTDNNL